MASIGPGTGSHIAFEMLVRLANIKMAFVPYPGLHRRSAHCWANM